MKHELKRLNEIKTEVGADMYGTWHRTAERELAQHPALWNHAEGRHACIYESIIRQYDAHRSEQGRTRVEDELHQMRMGL